MHPSSIIMISSIQSGFSATALRIVAHAEAATEAEAFAALTRTMGLPSEPRRPPPPTATKRLMKPKAVAELLDCTEREVRDLCVKGWRNGGLRAGKVGNKWRVHPDDLEEYLSATRGLQRGAR